MFSRFTLCLFLMPALAASAQTPQLTETQQLQVADTTCSNIALGPNGALNGFVPSPADAWHQDISSLPVSPMSDAIMNTNLADLAGYHLHPDFGTQAGIPYNVVDTSLSVAQYPQVPVSMTLYPTDSDLTTYPVWSGVKIEGSPGDCPTDQNDRHLLIIDRHSCTNYELYQAQTCKGKWSASNGNLFDLLATEQRPYGITSADAAGLSIFSGLVRYDEILAGVINHAIRFTAPHTKADGNGGLFVSPATHAAGNLYGTDNVMGQRIRLKAGYDISHFSPTNQVILTAMKKYGLILADNGGKLYFQGTNDSRWNDADLINLQSVVSSSFEVVQAGPQYDAVTAPKGTAPVIANVSVAPLVYAGTTFYLISANITGATYSYMDAPGVSNGAIFRGMMAVVPPHYTTYTLTSRNLYGTTQAHINVP